MEGIVERIWRALLVTVVGLGVLLVEPKTAHAGLIDFIWDMSGPQMVGAVLRCRVPLGGGTTQCEFVEKKVGIQSGQTDVMKGPRAWFNVEGAVYTSTGKNESDIDFRAFRTHMLAFDPVVEYAWVSNDRVRLFTGAGATLQFLFGDRFRRFGKAGFKVRPVGVELGDHVELAFNVRLYPDGFGADQFGFGLPPTGDRPFERTFGFTAGYKFKAR
jgi:hypothetical protein